MNFNLWQSDSIFATKRVPFIERFVFDLFIFTWAQSIPAFEAEMNRAVQFSRNTGANKEESQAAGSTQEVAKADDDAMNAPEMDQGFDENGEEETKEMDEPVDVEWTRLEKSNKLPNRADCLVEVKKNSPVALAIFVADLYVQQSSLFETGNDAIWPGFTWQNEVSRVCIGVSRFDVSRFFFLTYPLPGDLPHHTNDNSEQEKMKTCTIISVVCWILRAARLQAHQA